MQAMPQPHNTLAMADAIDNDMKETCTYVFAKRVVVCVFNLQRRVGIGRNKE